MDTPKRGLCELRALLPAAGGLWCPACPCLRNWVCAGTWSAKARFGYQFTKSIFAGLFCYCFFLLQRQIKSKNRHSHKTTCVHQASLDRGTWVFLNRNLSQTSGFLKAEVSVSPQGSSTGLPSVTLSQQHVPVRLQGCPCPCPFLASCLFAATPIRTSARNARKAPRSGGILLPLLPGISCPSCSRKHNQLGSPCFSLSSQGRTVQAQPQAGPLLAAFSGGELEGRIAGRHQHRLLLSVLLTICNEAKSLGKGCRGRPGGLWVLCRWRGHGHPRDPAEPSGDGSG